MAENETSTKAAGMTPEERLARGWQLFESVYEQSMRVDAQMRAIRDVLTRDPDPNHMALYLTSTGCELSEQAGDLYALRDMLRPEGVAA